MQWCSHLNPPLQTTRITDPSTLVLIWMRYWNYVINIKLAWMWLKIKDDIASENGQISGYIALDDLDQALEELLNSNQATAVATHALAYMMQGITQHINYPLAIYGTKSATSSQMYNTVWERVEDCELAGFKVRPFICDGASANGKMFKLHASDYPADEKVHRCMNKFADRPIYFVSDVPHLIKTTRNCMENSGSHLKSRYLMVSSSFHNTKNAKDSDYIVPVNSLTQIMK